MAQDRVASIAGVPRLLAGALEDIRTIAQGMVMLPELARILSSIEARVERVEAEMVTMREAVESMGGDLGELPARLDQLQDAIPLRRRRRRQPPA